MKFTLFPSFFSTVPLIIVNSACIVLLLVFGWQQDTERRHETEGSNTCQEQPKHTQTSVIRSSSGWKHFPLKKKNQPAMFADEKSLVSTSWPAHRMKWLNSTCLSSCPSRAVQDTWRGICFHDLMMFHHVVTNEKLGRDGNIYDVLCVFCPGLQSFFFYKKCGSFINLWNVTQSVLILWFINVNGISVFNRKHNQTQCNVLNFKL